MNKLRIIAVVLVTTSLAAFLAHARSAAAAGNQAPAIFQGSWVGENSLGVHLFETATPLDPNNSRVALVLSATADPTFGGMFPTAVAMTAFHGEAIRAGPQSFDFTKLAVGSDASGQIVYFLESSGTKVFTDPGHFHGAATLSIFGAAQDRDGDGWVDEGEVPLAIIAYTVGLRRMTLVQL